MNPIHKTHATRSALFAVLSLAIVAGGVGCGLPMKWHNLADQLPKATPEDPATSIFCVWEEAEGVDPDGKPCRGFAGKLTFFTRKQPMGVRIKGDVRVTVYDDQGQPEERGKPLHHWDFEGDAWAIHLQNSQLGAAYSVFIPYSRKGNHQAQCALQVRFTPENGVPLYSDTVAVLLTGPRKKRANEPLNAGTQTDKRTSLNSITIPLKEKRKAEFENASMQIGKSEINRVVAPVSELTAKQQLHPPGQYSPPASFATVPGTNPQLMATLPSAPPSVTPQLMPGQTAAPQVSPPQTLNEDPQAQPIHAPRPPAFSAWPHSANPLTAPQHPLLGNSP